MKKSNKTSVRTIIRKMVREEVAIAINEVITELKQPTQAKQVISKPKKPQKRIVEKKQFSSNSIINQVLNETAHSSVDEWETLGGGTFDSGKMNEVLSSQYSETTDAVQGTQQIMANPNDPMSQFLNKDYRQVMQKVDEKAKQKNGG